MIPIYRDVLRLQRPADVNDDASDRILRIPIGESHRRFHRDQKQRDRSVAPMRHSYHLTAADQARLFAVACIRIVGWFYSEPSESVVEMVECRDTHAPVPGNGFDALGWLGIEPANNPDAGDGK